MPGDFIGVTKRDESDRVVGVGGRPSTEIIGERSSIFFNESLDGVPRSDNLFAVRLLGRTAQIQMLKDLIKNQVASTDFQVKPVTDEEEEPSEEQIQAAKNAEEFFKGNFNTDPDTFDDLLNVILDDILDFDSGVIELVGDEDGNLKEMIPRDGLTFTKNVMDNGKLPTSDMDEPAYFQFGLATHARQFFNSHTQGIDLRSIRRQLSNVPFNRIFSREQKEFSREQIVWFSESGVSYQPYGIGRTQKVKGLAEVMINGDMHRNRFFQDNEFHKGILAVDKSMSQSDKKNLKKKLHESAGNEHELPVVGAQDSEYISIDPEPEKMQFLESQKYYTRLVIAAYGLNDVEAGLLENANKGISDDAKFKVFRQTTKPILNMIGSKFNREILPKLEEYKRVDGSLKWEFMPQNHFMESIENDMIQKELKNNTVTLNEARRRKGKDDFGEIGDMPQSAFEEYARANPAFVVEQITDLEDVPSGDSGGGGLFQSFLGNSDDDDSDDDKSCKDVENEKEERETGSPSQKIESYREAFKHSDQVLEQTKDALRNERGFNDVDGIVQHKDEMKDDVAEVFGSIDLEEQLRDEFPDEQQDESILVNADSIVESIDLRDRLGSVIESNNLGALEMSAEHHEQEIEQETEERLTIPDEAKVHISFNVLDTFTADIIRNQALQSATEVEDSVKRQLRNAILEGAEEGEGIPQITDRVSKALDDVSDNKAELVARTETLQSSRKGSQAFAESTDLVEGKEWIATDDSRTREWHDAMDGTIVPKEDQFTVPKVSDDQPNDYPRSVRVVGDDQPFNCRCSQAPVLAEDMPEDVEQFEAEFDNASVKLGMSKRKLEIWKEHSEYESSFKEFWERTLDEMSKTEIAEKFEMSKTTIYNWSD